jgi:hypothetical protein
MAMEAGSWRWESEFEFKLKEWWIAIKMVENQLRRI